MLNIWKLSRPAALQTALSVLLLCGWLPPLLAAQDEGQPGPPSLQFEIATEKARYSLGEPLYLTVRLRNPGSVTEKVFDRLRPSSGLVRVDITESSGRRIGLSPFSLVVWDSPPMDLAPGEEIGDVVPLFYGALGWTFAEPGRYSIKAVYRDDLSGGEVRLVQSNTLAIDIVSSGDGGELLLGREVPQVEAAKFMLWQGGDHLEAGKKLLRGLVDGYPGSAVADYAGYFLGRSLSRPFKDFARGKVRMPDCEGALAYFERVREDRLPTYLGIQKSLAQGKCYLLLGREELAAKHLEEARRLCGTHAEFRGLYRLIEKVEAG